MTDQVYSMPGHNNASESRLVKKAVGKHLRSRQKCNKKRRAAKPKTKFELMSNQSLQASSEEMLKRLLNDHRKPIARGDILDSVLNANLGRKFLLKKRADQRKFLAIGCAVYHAIAARRNPAEAFERLKQSAGLEQLRTRDPCAIIVRCLVDYGDTKSEKDRNRQYAARDARALSYIVRTRMDPQKVEEPEKGETLTKWAERESAYRSKQKPLRVCGKTSRTKKFSAMESLKQELSVIPASKQEYDVLMNWVKTGLLVFDPEDGGLALAAIVTPITLTADQAKSRPDKVCAEILQALTKVRGKAIVKTPKQPPWECDDDWD